MPDPIFTHDVALTLGGNDWEFEAEFDEDGEASVSPSAYPVHTLKQIRNVETLLELMCAFLKNFGTIESIEIKEKG